MTNLTNLILKINEQKIVLEYSQTSAEAVNALKQATDASKLVMQVNNIENVDIIMNDIEEVHDQMTDIHERLAEPTGIIRDLDEDELMRELEELTGESSEEPTKEKKQKELEKGKLLNLNLI